MRYKFPENFLWGAATASHQIEGGLSNNWTRWEQSNAERLAKTGLNPLAQDPENYISNSKYSPESFKYWKRDLEVMKKLDLKAYRLSVEWSRIQPKKGVFCKEEIDYYKRYLKLLKMSGIKVVLTCWHWSIPLWLEQEGGLLSKDIFNYFNKYVRFLVQELSEYVDYWITINEPESFVFSYLFGSWPPGVKNPLIFHKVFMRILPKMHTGAYYEIKNLDPKKPVSLAKSISYISAYNCMPWNKLVAYLYDWYVNKLFLDKTLKYMDYMGINFYFYNKLGVRGIKNDNDKVSDLGWWLQPEKLYNVVLDVYKRYKKPIFITENGLADNDDTLREWWIEESVKAMYKAISENVSIIGYLHWSLLDNFEWDKGYWPKFGLVSIDSKTKERVIKKSGLYYSEIIRNNGIM